jgi:hypothetical protein
MTERPRGRLYVGPSDTLSTNQSGRPERCGTKDAPQYVQLRLKKTEFAAKNIVLRGTGQKRSKSCD